MKHFFKYFLCITVLWVVVPVVTSSPTRAMQIFAQKEQDRRDYAALAGRGFSLYLEKKDPDLVIKLTDFELEELGSKVSDLLQAWYPGTESDEHWELNETLLLAGAGSTFDGSLEYRIAMDICYALKKISLNRPAHRGGHWFY